MAPRYIRGPVWSLWLIATCFCNTGKAIFRMEHLIKPSLDHQVILGTPVDYRTPDPSPALVQSVEYLTWKGTPYQLLFHRLNKTMPFAGRFVQTRTICHAFLGKSTTWAYLVLGPVFELCAKRGQFPQMGSILSDVIFVIADESLLGAWLCAIQRCLVPLNFFILGWSGAAFSHPPNIYLVDSCLRQHSFEDSIIPIPYFWLLFEPGGIQVLVSLARILKRDLSGRMVTIISGSRVVFMPGLTNPFDEIPLRAAHSASLSAFRSMVSNLARPHNFTYTVTFENSAQNPCDGKGEISVGIVLICGGELGECATGPLSLFAFCPMKTVGIAEVTQQSPLLLRNYATPFYPLVSGLLVGLCLLLPFLFRLLAVNDDGQKHGVRTYFLVVASGFWAQVPQERMSQKLLAWYTAWLLLATFISTNYTNILQSLVVVPELHYDDLSFDDMINQSYTFFSVDSQSLKQTTTDILELGVCNGTQKCAKIIQKEMVLVKHLQFFDEFTAGGGYTSLFSRRGKRVLLLVDAEARNYQRVAKNMNKQMMVGKEDFYNLPRWWSLLNVEKGGLLLETVERLREGGISDYFLNLFDVLAMKGLEANIQRAFSLRKQNAREDGLRQSESERIPVRDGLLAESFVLVLYGSLMALVAFAGEVCVNCSRPYLGRLFRMWDCKRHKRIRLCRP